MPACATDFVISAVGSRHSSSTACREHCWARRSVATSRPQRPDRPPAPVVASERVLPPEPLTSFVGRDDELATLESTLTFARIVTLHGPGGVGKTRIALHGAHRYGNSDGVRVGWVELAPLADPNATLYATADALGVRELDGVDPVGSLVRALVTSRRWLCSTTASTWSRWRHISLKGWQCVPHR